MAEGILHIFTDLTQQRNRILRPSALCVLKDKILFKLYTFKVIILFELSHVEG